MANTWDASEVGDAATLVDDQQPQQIQEKKVNKKKLAELEPNGKTLQLYTRDPKTGALIACESIKNVPKDVTAICSDYIYEKLQDGRQYYHVIKPAEIESYKYIFEWIKTCAAEQNVAQIPDTEGLINEEEGFQPLIDVLSAARKLKIPEASFAKFIIKKSKDMAKQHLPPIELVRKAYDNFPEGDDDVALLGPILRELLVLSIFDHWYNYKLDAEEYDEYMESLGISRQDIPQLDEDLRAAVEDKDNFIKAAREKRRLRDAGGDNAADDFNDTNTVGGDAGWPGQAENVGTGTDWNEVGGQVQESLGSWNQMVAPSVTTLVSDRHEEDSGHVESDVYGVAEGVDWADEVNEKFNPAPVAPINVW